MVPSASSVVPVQDTHALMDFFTTADAAVVVVVLVVVLVVVVVAELDPDPLAALEEPVPVAVFEVLPLPLVPFCVVTATVPEDVSVVDETMIPPVRVDAAVLADPVLSTEPVTAPVVLALPLCASVLELPCVPLHPAKQRSHAAARRERGRPRYVAPRVLHEDLAS